MKYNHLIFFSSLNWFRISLVLSGFFWLAVLSKWFLLDPVSHLKERIPGMDGEPLEASIQSEGLLSDTQHSAIGEFFKLFDGVPSAIKANWPRFRGSSFDNISKETVPLDDFSKTQQPQILWTIPLGEGHAAPAVHNGRVYVLDYDEDENADALRCFSLHDGKEIWRRWYKVKVKRNHGMSRTIPAVTDSFVVTLGPRCHVMCTDPVTGDMLWGIDLEKQYGTEVPLWYTGQCPLIDDTVAVIAPGGRALLIGVHCRTGEILWETPNKHGWKMSHSSVMPMQYGGRSIYLYCAAGGFAGVAADGEDRGSILFETDAFNQSVVAPAPVVMDDGYIFMTAGYGGGSCLFKVTEEDGVFSIASVKRTSVKDGLASEQQTPLYYRDYLYAVLPKDAGVNRSQFVCVDAKDPSSVVWTSGPESQFGLGPFLIANDRFYILSDDGVLTVAKVSSRRFEKLGSIRLMDGVDAWGPMALVDGRLLVRDSRRMICVDLNVRTPDLILNSNQSRK